MKTLPLKEKSFDMGTAQKTPGGQICTVFHPKTLQREQKRETKQGRKLKIHSLQLENRNACERLELQKDMGTLSDRAKKKEKKEKEKKPWRKGNEMKDMWLRVGFITRREERSFGM